MNSKEVKNLSRGSIQLTGALDTRLESRIWTSSESLIGETEPLQSSLNSAISHVFQAALLMFRIDFSIEEPPPNLHTARESPEHLFLAL